MGMNRRIWIVCAAVLALVAPTAAQAAPTWLAPTPLSGGNDYEISAATSAGGDTVLGLRDTSNGAPYPASAGFRPAGGPTSPITAVDPTATGAIVYTPAVAINSHGDAAMAWTDGTTLWLATRSAGSAAFSAPVAVTPLTGGGSPRVAMDDAGTIFLAWTATSGLNTLTFFVVRAPDGTLGPIGSSAAGQSGASPTIAAAHDGHAIIAWSRSDGTHAIIQAATRAPGAASFTAVGDLSDSAQSASSPDVAVGDGGDAAITWMRSDGTHLIVQVARREGDGLFSTGLGLSPTTVDSRYPAVAVNADGQVVVSWSIAANEADARVGSVAGDFGPRISFPTTGGGQTDAALNDDGVGLVTWMGSDGSGFASVMPSGATFGAPDRINPEGSAGFAVQNVHSTTASVDAEGNAVTYARANQGGVLHVYERLYDGAGPRLESLSVPASATAGTSAAFAVAPFDVVSSVASTSWSFGDGSPAANGTTAQHTFAAAGSYDVKVTSTDAVGNTSSATRKVTVAAAAVVPQILPVGPPPLVPKPKPSVRCKVPSLKNLTVTRAKSKLKSGHCKLGKVTTPRKFKHKKGLVVRSQSRKAGSGTVDGAKVNVTLGTKPKPKRKKARGR
jgi:hypothetical protein